MSEPRKVVVIGGGFGGLSAAQHLSSYLIQWAIQDLTFSRGARLITGAAPTDFNFTQELSDVCTGRDIKPETVDVAR